jgi:tetratricopeptide (TPR) repeat protein
MKRKVFIAIATAMISASANVSSAQSKNPLPPSPPSKLSPALSEEQVKSLIQTETEKKDALQGQAEAERKFDTTMVWVQVLLGGVSLLLAFITIVPILLGILFWIFRKSIFGQLNAEAKEEVSRQVEEHLRPIIDTEVEAQVSALIERIRQLNHLVQEFEAVVPASTQETPSPEKLSQIDELRRRIEDFQDLIPTVTQSAEYYFKQGNAFYFEKQYDEAIASYGKALDLNPDLSEVLSNQGVAYSKLNRYEEAIACYDKALELNPDLPEAWSNRGVSLDNLSRYEEAITSYDKALNLKQSYVAAWYNRACCNALQEKLDETVHDLTRAIELDLKCRETAKTDSDFDKVRRDKKLQKLLNGES